MQRISRQFFVLGLTLGLFAFLNARANAEGRGGAGDHHAPMGDAARGNIMPQGGNRGGETLSGHRGADVRIQGGVVNGERNEGHGGRVSGGTGMQGNWEGNRGDWNRNNNWNHGGDWNRGGDWNHGNRSYYSYYGRGWGYNPGFGWGINIPFGRYGGIGVGDYYGGYGGYGYGAGYYGRPSYYGNYYYDESPIYYENSSSMATNVDSGGENEQNTDNNPAEDKLPPVPTSKELARFTDQQLQSFIAWAANGFTQELGQYKSGDTWVKYFRLKDLQALAPHAPGASANVAANDQPSENISKKSRNVIEEVSDRMDTAEKNDEYKMITGSWGFQALQVALKEAARSSEEREPGVLKGQAEILAKSLERVSTGDGWRKHLEIDSLQKLADQKDAGSSDEFQKIAARYDRVAQNPEYQAISQLPGFGGVYGTLHKMMDGQQTPTTANRAPNPPEETKRE